MEYRTYDANRCIMTKIINLMSGKWKPIILYLVRGEINRFSSLQRSMPVITKKVLTEQLRELEVDGLISKQVSGTKAPYVVIYSLTEKGASLRALMDGMLYWGFHHLMDDSQKMMVQKFLLTPASEK